MNHICVGMFKGLTPSPQLLDFCTALEIIHSIRWHLNTGGYSKEQLFFHFDRNSKKPLPSVAHFKTVPPNLLSGNHPHNTSSSLTWWAPPNISFHSWLEFHLQIQDHQSAGEHTFHVITWTNLLSPWRRHRHRHRHDTVDTCIEDLANNQRTFSHLSHITVTYIWNTRFESELTHSQKARTRTTKIKRQSN